MKKTLVLGFLLLGIDLFADFIFEMEQRILKISDEISPNVVQIEVELKEEIHNYFRSSDKVSGCGLILGDQNYIITNYHISDKTNIKKIEVTFSDSVKAVEATLVGSDEMNDLALLKVDSIPYEVKKIRWGKIHDVQAGQFVLAIGDPYGLEKTISFGLISKVKRDLLTYEINPFIQSDLNITHGNSGGPLINMNGEVIGINNKANDFAFSIPVDVVLESIEKMKKGDVVKPYFGIKFDTITKDHRKFFQNDSLTGILFEELMYKSPAANSDLIPGDIIIAVNEQELSGHIDDAAINYRRYLNKCEIGSKATLTIWRFGKTHKIEFPVIKEPKRMIRKGFDCDNWGFIVKELTEKIIFNNSYFESVKKGQLEIVEADSDFGYTGFRNSFVILGIVVDNHVVEINDLDDLEKIYEEHKNDELIMLKITDRENISCPIITKVDKKLESLEK